jgi:hypothetical protein
MREAVGEDVKHPGDAILLPPPTLAQYGGGGAVAPPQGEYNNWENKP